MTPTSHVRALLIEFISRTISDESAGVCHTAPFRKPVRDILRSGATERQSMSYSVRKTTTSWNAYHNSLVVEHVQPAADLVQLQGIHFFVERHQIHSLGSEILPGLLRFECDESWKKQNQFSSLVHDWSFAKITPYFARQFVSGFACLRIVPFEILRAVDEVDIFFVEDGCPLEWCA